MENNETSLVSLHSIDTRSKIRTLYLNGYNFVSIQKELGIVSETWESCYYRDTQSFRSFIFGIKREKMLLDAERVSSQILSMKAENNAKMLAIMQKEAEFLRETQGKDQGYSKRIETIGLNINKTEPLDDDQKEKLAKLFKKAGSPITQETDIVKQDENTEEVSPENGST